MHTNCFRGSFGNSPNARSDPSPEVPTGNISIIQFAWIITIYIYIYHNHIGWTWMMNNDQYSQAPASLSSPRGSITLWAAFCPVLSRILSWEISEWDQARVSRWPWGHFSGWLPSPQDSESSGMIDPKIQKLSEISRISREALLDANVLQLLQWFKVFRAPWSHGFQGKWRPGPPTDALDLTDMPVPGRSNLYCGHSWGKWWKKRPKLRCFPVFWPYHAEFFYVFLWTVAWPFPPRKIALNLILSWTPCDGGRASMGLVTSVSELRSR